MGQQPGLRERKKHKTHALIVETALRLFAARGFEAVSVAEIARQAELSEATVFNYFPTKEDLVYQGMETFEERLLDAVRDRPAGVTVLDAFGEFVLQPRGLLAADATDTATLLAVSRMIAASPALLAREQQVLARYTDSLATLLAEQTAASPDELAPTVVANTLIGLHRSLIDLVRRRIAEEPVDRERLARDVRTEGDRALALLRTGLADYGVTRPAGNPQRR